MKTPIQKLLLLTAIFCGQSLAQQVRTAPATTLAAIPEPIHDGTPSETPTPIEKPQFQIESTQVKLIDVVKSPPMPGLPPIAGTMTLKVHSVADPGLPDPPSPQPIILPEDPAFRERLAELAEEHIETHFAFISATVYDRSRTRLICYPSGGGDKAITVWSNIDFNHFSGIGTFEVTGTDGTVRNYHLMLGIYNEDTEHEVPEIPALPDGTPAFVIVTKDSVPESVKLIEDLHAFYRDEKDNMAAAAAAREKAYEDKKAYLLANPPKPKDVTVRFWNRETVDPR